MKFLKNVLLFFVLSCATTSCMTRAPSDYQLDMKAGLIPPNRQKDEQKLKDNLSVLKAGRNPIPNDDKAPIYTPPLIEEVYVYPQKLSDDSFLAGTWMWIVVDKGDWYTSQDTGWGKLLDTKVLKN